MTLFNWNNDQAAILNKLSHFAQVKLCVKTRNEAFFIKLWIEHHANIVGYKNLVIADNSSDDQKTLEIYNEYRDLVTIFQFSGPHNAIHWHPTFFPLFETIRNSCVHFSFIDTDERMIWIEPTKWVADGRILEQLNNRDAIYPMTWLINKMNSINMFTFLDTEEFPRIENNLKWGKPLLPSRLVGLSDAIHNIGFSGEYFAETPIGKFFLLHLTKFPEQRIETNRNKIASRNIVNIDITVDQLLSMDLDSHHDSDVRRFIKEIRIMQNFINNADTSKDISIDLLELLPDGQIEYSSDSAAKIMVDFLRSDSSDILSQK